MSLQSTQNEKYPLLDSLGKFLSEACDKMNASRQKLITSFEERRTVCEVLEDHLSDEEFHKASRYISLSISRVVCSDIKTALLYFDWSNTIEGRPYWANVYSRFE